MPKEKIHSAYPSAPDHPEPKVEVRWSRETEHVQVATVMPDNVPLVPTPEGNGWYATLDRNQINQLIVVLRKARDQAFGADA